MTAPPIPRLAPVPRLSAAVILACSLVLQPAFAQGGFRFSNPDNEEQEKKDARDAQVRDLLATPCRERIKNQKIVVLIGESRNGSIDARQGTFSPQFDAINLRLRALGLRTYTQAEITRQVAQAEMDAYFKNDPDAAIGAAKRLAAQYVLKGLITTHATRNSMINVNQVSVGMTFTLTGANGRMISQASAQEASYAGADVSGMALTLIDERADEVVAKLYSDYCRAAGAR